MKIAPLLIAGLLVACTTSPPQQHAIDTAEIIARPQAEAWSKLVVWSTGTGLPIGLADERSGTMQLTLTSDWIGRHVDCGRTHSVTLPDPQGTVTIQLSPNGDATNAVVRVAATDRMWLANSADQIARAPCYSRGTLEQQIFAALRV